MAFNFLGSLLDTVTARNEDENDEIEDNNGSGSDIECDEAPDNVEHVARTFDSADLPGEIADPSDEEENESESRPNDCNTWSSTLTDVAVDIFTQRTGPDVPLTYKSEPSEFFDLFLGPAFFESCATQTKLYASLRGNTEFCVTPDDMRTFFYCNIMFGIHVLPNLYNYWSSDPLLKVSAIADVISRNRYLELSRYFHINDNSTYIPKGTEGHEPMHKVLPMIELVKDACTKYFRPGIAISVDEAMIPFKGRLSFKQYIKGKPCPWGVKVWCLADSATGYLVSFYFYTGKEEGLTMPNGLGYSVVWSLAQHFLHKFHHLYFDNFFSSVKLAQDLLDHQTYSCSTVRRNRKGWPADLKTTKIPPGTVKFRQCGNMVACLWHDKREIAILSTNSSPRTDDVTRNLKGTSGVTKAVPLPVLAYNNNMGGVDLNDQLRSYYPCGRKSFKWWRCCVWYLLEVSIINAYLLYKNMPRPPQARVLTHLQFQLAIARHLLKPLRKRPATETPSVASIASPLSRQHTRVKLLGRKKQCYECRLANVKTATGRRPETTFGCPVCNVHLCDELCYNKFHEKLV